MHFRKLIRRTGLHAAALALALGGARGAAGADSGTPIPGIDALGKMDWKDFFTLHDSKNPKGGTQSRHLFCPEVIVLEGTAAAQVHAGAPPSNMNLRYQYALGEVVRDCAMQGDQIAIKVGIAGNVLLGPAGAPASFSVPLRVAIVGTKDNEPIVTKLYRVAATIAAGQAQTEFTLVTEPLLVPFTQDHAEDDYTIKVGIDEGPQKADKRKP